MSLRETDVGTLLDTLGARTPTPGGGAACAIVAAVAAALARMVVNYSVGKKTLLEHEPAHHAALEDLSRLEAAALRLAEEDQVAYATLNAVWRLPADDPTRSEAMPQAVRGAIDVPLRSLDAAVELLRLLETLTTTTNAQLASDLAIAAVFAHAAADAAAWNVRINLPSLDARDDAAALTQAVDGQLAAAATLRAAVETACGRGG